MIIQVLLAIYLAGLVFFAFHFASKLMEIKTTQPFKEYAAGMTVLIFWPVAVIVVFFALYKAEIRDQGR